MSDFYALKLERNASKENRTWVLYFFELTRHLKQRKQAFTYLNKT